MALELTDRQRVTVATALTILSACVIVFAVGGLFWLLGAFTARFSGVFLPLAVAAVAALVTKPYYEWLRRKARLGPVLALTAVFLSVIVPLGGVAVFFGVVLVSEGSDLVRQLPGLWQKAVTHAREYAPTVVTFVRENPYMQRLTAGFVNSSAFFLSGAQVIGEQTLSAGADLLSRIGRLLGWVVLPIYFAFFLMGEPWKIRDAERYLPFLKAETRRDVAYLIEQFVEILVAFFRGQLIIAFLQGLLFGLGFWMVGLKYGFVLGLLFGFLNIIPYLGSILTLVTTIPLALLQPGGGVMTALLVLVVFTVVQMIEGYLLTPRIMGDRTGLHPMAIIVAIFFWGSALDGLTGMILAIPLTAFLVVFWRLAKDKWVAELV